MSIIGNPCLDGLADTDALSVKQLDTALYRLVRTSLEATNPIVSTTISVVDVVVLQ